jgi:hypothetical protein
MGRLKYSAEQALQMALKKQVALKDCHLSLVQSGCSDSSQAGFQSGLYEVSERYFSKLVFGMALDWEKGWVFLPDEVQMEGLVDSSPNIRWDHLASYIRRRKLRDFLTDIMEDDSTKLPMVDLIHMNAVFVDFRSKEYVPLYHGHRIFKKLTCWLQVVSGSGSRFS